MSVGATIKKLRLKKGLTQEELGELLGVKKAAVQKYESGQVQNLKQTTIKKLCEIFNKNPSYFIFDNFDHEFERQLRNEIGYIEMISKNYGNEAVEILEMFICLNEENKKKVIQYANDMSIIQSVKI